MLDKSPDRRISIFNVQQHPIVSTLHAMLLETLKLAAEGSSTPSMQGAIIEEGETFLEQVFNISLPCASSETQSIAAAAPESAPQDVGMDLD